MTPAQQERYAEAVAEAGRLLAAAERDLHESPGAAHVSGGPSEAGYHRRICAAPQASGREPGRLSK